MKQSLFIDYLLIYRLIIVNDNVSMECYYIDPATSMHVPETFHGDFSMLYSLLRPEYSYNAENVLNQISREADFDDHHSIIDLPEDEPLILHSSILRLSPLHGIDEEENIDYLGYFIEDTVPFADQISFGQFVNLPKGDSSDQEIEKLCNALSANLASLTLRYQYYLISIRGGMSPEKAAALSSMEDMDDLDTARAAHSFLKRQKAFELSSGNEPN